jgi:chitinase
VVLSLGGWEDSDNFPAIASSARLRAEFSHSCLEAVRKYGFDGVDVDWEYPGFAEHKGTPEDRVNFTLLLSSLRDSLAAHGRREGREYLLTAALSAAAVHARNLEARKIAELLDYLNLMTYDFHGPWDPVVNHNAPLFPSDGADPERCLDAAFRLYRDTLGIPASKITLGVPFYGRAYAGTVALHSTHAGADTTVFPGAGPFFYDLAPAIGQFTRIWDDKARVPYLVNTPARVVVSYDDEMSVREKARYVMEHGAGGVIIWEITGDFMPDGTTPLLDALLSGLH